MSASLIEQAIAAAGSYERFWDALPQHLKEELPFDWRAWGRPEQLEPPGDWNTWLILAGRAFGKSCTGAQTVRNWAMRHPGCKIALVARTAADVRDVMLSALQNPWKGGMLRPHEIPFHEPSNRMVRWKNGSFAITYSAEEPNALRGPQHDFAWCDELAAWQYPEEAWHEGLKMGLRGSGLPGVRVDRPRVVVTTTPRPIPLVRQLVALPTTHVTRGSTFDNSKNLPNEYILEMRARYDGTRLGRQELHAELLDDVEGALWNHALIERTRKHEVPILRRIVVGVDPSGSAKRTADEAGIVVAGIGDCHCLGRVDQHAFVLEDLTGKYDPAKMGDVAIGAYHKYKADRIVIEDNFGGKLTTDVLGLIDKTVATRSVHAKVGKRTRAEPVAALYEKGRVHHIGLFKHLEDEMCQYAPLTSTDSPGRLDALVWALTDLMLGETRASFGNKAFKGPSRTFGDDLADVDWSGET